MIVGKKSNVDFNDRRQTTITGISRRRPTIDSDSMEHAQSAPSSPNLSHVARRRTEQNYIPMNRIDVVRIKKHNSRPLLDAI
jgi:hypothetical protein